MTFKEVLEVETTVLLSLGGGGSIVLGLSSYLGKRWADRALQDQQHKYAQLNLQMQNQLDLATRRLQVELDAIGHLHKLRTEETVSKIAGLWKRIAEMQNWFNILAGEGLRLVPADNEARKKQDDEVRLSFYQSLNDAQKYLHEEMLFVPKHMTDVALQILSAAQRETFNFATFGPFLATGEMFMQYRKARAVDLKTFNEKASELEELAREYLAGGPRANSAQG